MTGRKEIPSELWDRQIYRDPFRKLKWKKVDARTWRQASGLVASDWSLSNEQGKRRSLLERGEDMEAKQIGVVADTSDPNT